MATVEARANESLNGDVVRSVLPKAIVESVEIGAYSEQHLPAV